MACSSSFRRQILYRSLDPSKKTTSIFKCPKIYKVSQLSHNITSRMIVAERLFPGRSAVSILKKIGCDQFIFSPIMMATFLMINECMNNLLYSVKIKKCILVLAGHGVAGGMQKLNVDFVDMIIANWTLWIPVQLTNFYFTPLNYRVVFIQVAAFFWNTYVAWKANRVLPDTTKE